MALPENLEKTIDKTPFYAVVGAGDLAVEKLRGARAEFESRATKFDATSFRDQAQAVFGEYVASAVSAYDGLAGRGRTVVTRLRHQDEEETVVDFAEPEVPPTTTPTPATAAPRVKSRVTSTRKATAKETTSTPPVEPLDD